MKLRYLLVNLLVIICFLRTDNTEKNILVATAQASDKGKTNTAKANNTKESLVIGVLFSTPDEIKTSTSQKFKGQYFLPSDQCYSAVRKNTSTENLVLFKSDESARSSGYIRTVFGLKETKMYFDVCSNTWEWFWFGSCEKIIFRNKQEAEALGYFSMARTGPFPVPVAALKEKKDYAMKCEPLFDCFVGLRDNWQPKWCNENSADHAEVLIFPSEQAARDAGYFSSLRYRLGEHGFSITIEADEEW